MVWLLGVSLNVWKAVDTKKIEWTSLHGGEKRILLRKLPDFLCKILPPERAPTVMKLWPVSTKLKQSVSNNVNSNNYLKNYCLMSKRYFEFVFV